MKRKKLVSAALALVFVALAAFGVYRYREINRLYPNPRLVTDENGVLQIDGFTIEVLDFTPTLEREFLERNPTVTVFSADKKDIIFQVHLRLTNTTQESTAFQLFNFYLESRLWSNGIETGLFMEAGGNTLSPSFESGESKEFNLTYRAAKFAFYPEDWEKLLKEEFHLVLLEKYPVLYRLQLQNASI